MSLGRRPVDDASMAYSNRTLVSNWWEDRYQPPAPSKLSTTDRIMALDIGALPAPPPELVTTKRAHDHARMTNPLPAPVKKPSMYNDATLQERLHTYGIPDSQAYTLGRTMLDGKGNDTDRLYETTNQHFFEKLPEAATTSNPDYFAATGKEHFKRDCLKSDTLNSTNTVGGDACGRGGNRGEVTRNPRESGNPYGVSVFVDEYAKWQTKLNGMPLSESVRRAQTKYF